MGCTGRSNGRIELSVVTTLSGKSNGLHSVSQNIEQSSARRIAYLLELGWGGIQ